LIGKIAGFLDIEIPFLGNLGDRPVLDFVLGVLGFHGGVK